MTRTRIPDEDLGPVWLRDYESIEVDLRGMRDYANALKAELEQNYLPHRREVNDDMTVQAASPDGRFLELCFLLDRHWESQVMTTALLTAHGDATQTFSVAAQTISQRYGDTDGLVVARAKDIQGIITSPPPVATPPPPEVSDAGG